MNINEKIRRAIDNADNIHHLCRTLRTLCNPHDAECPAKKLLYNIRHYSITKENANDINILYDKSGDTSIISPDSLLVLTFKLVD